MCAMRHGLMHVRWLCSCLKRHLAAKKIANWNVCGNKMLNALKATRENPKENGTCVWAASGFDHFELLRSKVNIYNFCQLLSQRSGKKLLSRSFAVFYDEMNTSRFFFLTIESGFYRYVSSLFRHEGEEFAVTHCIHSNIRAIMST